TFFRRKIPFQNSYLSATMKLSTRKEEIIKTASRLFYDKGFKAVSMRDIATVMDIKAASLYNHINSKQEILSAIILEVAEAFTTGMENVVGENISAINKIEKVIELHIEITVNHSDALAALITDWLHLEEADLNAFVKMRDDYEENFRRIIKHGIEAGEIKPYHPEVVLFSILSTLRTLYLWYQKRGKLDVNILKKDMVSVLKKGIV